MRTSWFAFGQNGKKMGTIPYQDDVTEFCNFFFEKTFFKTRQPLKTYQKPIMENANLQVRIRYLAY